MAYAIFSFALFVFGFIAGCVVCRRMGQSQAERTRRVDDDYRELGEQQADIARSIDRAGELAERTEDLNRRATENVGDSKATIEAMGDDVRRAGDILADIQKRNRAGASD